MTESCHNCGSPWFEGYGSRCGSCGATTPDIPTETGEEQEALDIVEASQSEPQPSLEQQSFFDASPSSTEIP
jgi:hypothetical protein